MNILIPGTSNSILKNAWGSGLRESQPNAKIQILSVGVSPGIEFSASRQLNFAACDVVFLDRLAAMPFCVQRDRQ
jgi:hypothetical protein